jgi:hypothetical protein
VTKTHRRIYYTGDGKYHDIPISGAENRRQAEIEICDLSDRVRRVKWSLGVRFDKPGEHLDADESVLLSRARSDLEELAEKLKRSGVDRLAGVAPPEDPIKDLFEDWNSRLRQFMQRQEEPMILKLALEILLDADVDEETVDELRRVLAGELGIGRWGSARNRGPIWACPWCDGEHTYRKRGEYKDHDCARCKGAGWLYQEDAPEEDGTSEAGKLAISAGDPWTLEDEAKANGYDSLEQALAEGWEPPPWFAKQPAVERQR